MSIRNYSASALRLLLLALLTGAVSLTFVSQSQAQVSTEAQPGVALNAADVNGASFTLLTGDTNVAADGQITAAGLADRTAVAGAPDLPVYRTLLAVPAGATVSVDVSASRFARLTAATVQARPELQLEAGVDREALAFNGLTNEHVEAVSSADPELYSSNAFYPSGLYTLSPVQTYRDLQVVELTLHPVRINPVTGQLTAIGQLDVAVTFELPTGFTPQPAAADSKLFELESQILNAEAAQLWAGTAVETAAAITFANSRNATGTQLPVGQDAFKIAVTEDGIHAVSFDDLVAAGMPNASVNPATIEMNHRGAAVAFDMVEDDSNGQFDSGDEIRFYGWAFDSSRHEEFYVNDNIYWLWLNGTRTPISSTSNPIGTGTEVDTFRSTLDFEEIDYLFLGYDTDWEESPNEPDYLFWRAIRNTTTSPVTETFSIDLPDPVTSSPTAANFLLELQSGSYSEMSARININSGAAEDAHTWNDFINFNRVVDVPASGLIDGANEVAIANLLQNRLFVLNRITVDYDRHLNAVDDRLRFGPGTSGAFQYTVSGFSENTASNMHAWDITDPLQPVKIPLDVAGAALGSGSFKIAVSHNPDGEYLLSTESGVISTSGEISKYTVTDITPPSGTDWVAVTHSTFRTQAEDLATHRSQLNHGGLDTFVVDFEDVREQYGYGLPIPEGIRDYLKVAYQNDDSLRYVLLLGDADFNPRLLPCTDCRVGSNPDRSLDWTLTNPNFVPTYFEFIDFILGIVPIDYTYSLIEGNDDFPELAVGRLSVETTAEATVAIDKIKRYENNLETPASYQSHFIFASDDPDSGGNFPLYNNDIISDSLPASFTTTHIINDPTPTKEQGAINFRAELYDAVNNQHATMVNWRGHGYFDNWGAQLINVIDDAPIGGVSSRTFANPVHPMITISMDCLDGNFMYQGWEALSEALLRFNGAGSAAHISSGGYGYAFDHNILSTGYYEALFDEGLSAVGDALNYSKMYFANSNPLDYEEVYKFILQGDPAMQIIQSEISLDATSPSGTYSIDDNIDIPFTVTNAGSLPAHTSISLELAEGLTYVSASSSEAIDVDVTSNGGKILITVTFTDPVDILGDTKSASIRVKPDGSVAGSQVSNRLYANGGGHDLSPISADGPDDEETILISIGGSAIYLPLITQ